MNRLQFFKWIGKGAAGAIALPLLPLLPKTPSTVHLVKQIARFGSPFTAAEVTLRPLLVEEILTADRLNAQFEALQNAINTERCEG